jgi:hypothetical protein
VLLGQVNEHNECRSEVQIVVGRVNADGDVVDKMLSLTLGWSWSGQGQSTPNTKWTIDQAWRHGPFPSAVDKKADASWLAWSKTSQRPSPKRQHTGTALGRSRPFWEYAKCGLAGCDPTVPDHGRDLTPGVTEAWKDGGEEKEALEGARHEDSTASTGSESSLDPVLVATQVVATRYAHCHHLPIHTALIQ